MSTLKERFEEKFPQPTISSHEPDCECPACNGCYLKEEDVLTFIKTELESLAEEMEKNAPHKSGTFFLEGMRRGRIDAAAIIRNRANELEV